MPRRLAARGARRRPAAERSAAGIEGVVRLARRQSDRSSAGTKRYMISQATGAATSSESRRSITPPWPGRNELMSLIPRSRLIMRLDQVAAGRRPRPGRRRGRCPTQNGACSPKTAISTPAAMPKTTEPAKPSQDFFGLIFGAIGCLPNSTPADVAAGVAHHHDEHEGDQPGAAVLPGQHQRREGAEQRHVADDQQAGGGVLDVAVGAPRASARSGRPARSGPARPSSTLVVEKTGGSAARPGRSRSRSPTPPTTIGTIARACPVSASALVQLDRAPGPGRRRPAATNAQA